MTCGYEGYCLSGNSEPVNWKFFGLEKPDFHNRRIYSAAWIVVRNLPGRQYIYLPRRRKDAKSASSSEYHNPYAAWRQRLSPYLKGTVIWQVWSDSPLKIRGVPPKAGGVMMLMENWEFKKLEVGILNYEFSFCLFFFLPVWIFVCATAVVLPFRQQL